MMMKWKNDKRKYFAQCFFRTQRGMAFREDVFTRTSKSHFLNGKK